MGSGPVRVAGIAAIGLVAAVVVHATSGTGSKRADADPSVIPWVPLPAHGLVLAADYPTCTPQALTASASAPGVVMDAYRLKISVSNEGLDCALPDAGLRLKATTSGGSSVYLATAVGDSASGSPVVEQGSTLDYYVEFDASCSSSAKDQPLVDPVAISISGSDVPVKGTSLPDALTSCSKVQFTAPPSDDDESAFPGLTATVNLPGTADSPTLTYSVTLTNGSSRPVTFTTCPLYKQTAEVYKEGQVSETYQLNCAGARTIGAGGSTTYAMRIHIPKQTGGLKVGWFLDHGPSSAGGIGRE